MKYLERYNTENECWPLALDFAIQYLAGSVHPHSELKKINTIFSTIQIIKRHQINFLLSIPLISLLSPLVWLIILTNLKKISVGNKLNKHKLNLQNRKIKYATFYHLTSKQLYNISGESWTHCIIGYWDMCNFCIYDPLFAILKEENPFIDFSPHETDLDNTLSIKLLLWK